MKTVKDNVSDPNMCTLLDRNKCFSVVAAAVKEVVSDSTVDLKSPEVVISELSLNMFNVYMLMPQCHVV